MSTEIKRTTIVEQVMDKIKELIASGNYKPGDKLPPEGDLAAEWGVARSSIREAVKTFNYLGLLESHAGKGTFLRDRTHISGSALSLIALLGNNESSQIVDMRFSLELWCALDLASAYSVNISEACSAVGLLDDLVKKMFAAKDSSELINLDISFHEKIIRAHSNDLFTDIFCTLRDFSYNVDSIVHSNFSDISEIAEAHLFLLEQIKHNDASAITSAFKAHQTKTLEMYHISD